MPRGYFHESWKRLAAESDYLLDNPSSAPEMVKAELLLFPVVQTRTQSMMIRPYKNQLVTYHKDDKQIQLTYTERLDECLVKEGWQRELKTYTKDVYQFVRTDPVWVPIMNRLKIHPEAFIRCKPYVTKMYNPTFPKKVHVRGHLWIEPVRIVSQRVTFDELVYFNEPHISNEMAAMSYNKFGG